MKINNPYLHIVLICSLSVFFALIFGHSEQAGLFGAIVGVGLYCVALINEVKK